MSTIDLCSKCQKELNEEIPDVYIYDQFPKELRIHIICVWENIFKEISSLIEKKHGKQCNLYKTISKELCEEFGRSELVPLPLLIKRDFKWELETFMKEERDINKILDTVGYILKRVCEISINAKIRMNLTVIEEKLNERFKQHNVGYQFLEGEIIRVDSTFLHSEIVKPVLNLLNREQFKGVQQEFLNAFEHHRHGRNKEALNECLKSFESAMKVICDIRGWPYKPTDTAKNLIEICLNNKLIPEFWQQNFTSLRSLLESSIPIGRNKLSGHGQGSEQVSVPDYL